MKSPGVFHHYRKTFALAVAALLLMGKIATGAEDFDHHYPGWQKLLAEYTKEGFVDYRTLKKKPEDLRIALNAVERVTKGQYDKWSNEQQLAFWLNVYNLATIDLVVRHYPLQKRFGWKLFIYPDNSIQQIDDVWDRRSVHVLGKGQSLNNIEHEILRKEFIEPRVHFALVCASIGCPKLRDEPYVAVRLDDQLEAQTKSFLNNTGKARYEEDKKILYLSPIFKWFREDFEQAAGSLAAFVQSHGGQAYAALDPAHVEVKFLDYDWSLNVQKEDP